MDGETTITLPAYDDMLQRLAAMDNVQHSVRYLHPILLDSAGQEKAPAGVALYVIQSLTDYTDGMPAAVWLATMSRARDYVTALVDDEAARAEVFTFLDLLGDGAQSHNPEGEVEPSEEPTGLTAGFSRADMAATAEMAKLPFSRLRKND